MKLLITGIAGFVGSRLAEVALKRGFEVKGISRKEIDLTNSKAVSDLLLHWRPDAILHVAARLPRTPNEEAEIFLDDNIRASLNVLHYAKEAGVKQVVLSSTMSVYDSPPIYLPVDEKHPAELSNPYGMSKRALEIYAKLYASDKMRVTILRYSGIYGKGQKSGAIPAFIGRCLKNEPIYLESEGKPTSDYVWIENVVEANLLALKAPLTSNYEIFNIGSGVELSVLSLAEMIRSFCSSNSQISFSDKSSPRNFRFYFDVTKAKQHLGYAPTSPETALKNCIQQWRERPW